MNTKWITFRLAVVGLIAAAALFGLLSVDRARAEAPQLINPTSVPKGVGQVAYVPMRNDNGLGLIDISTHTYLGMIDLAQFDCSYPQRARLNPDGSELYITCDSSHSILVLDTRDYSQIADIYRPGVCEQDVTFVRGGAYALASTNDCEGIYQIDVIDTGTHSIVQSIYTENYSITSLTAHPYLPLAYAGAHQCCFLGYVLVIDTETFTIQTVLPYGGVMWGVQTSLDGSWVFATDYYYQAGVIKIDTQTNEIIDSTGGLGELFGVEISPDGSTLFVAGGWNGTIYMLDAIDLSYITSIFVGGDTAFEMALSCDGRELYVSNGSASVPVIDAHSFELVDSIELPATDSTYGIAICPEVLGRSGALTGHVYDQAPDPISDARVYTTPGPYEVRTDADGYYSMSMLVGTYTVTAEAYGYYPASTVVEIITDTTLTQDFSLAAAPPAVISGTVTDALTGWPVYSYISIEGYPAGGLWTDPVTGFYSVSLPQGASYEVSVSPWATGYLTTTQVIGPFDGDRTVDLTVEADLLSCTAPGYRFTYAQNFEANNGDFTTYGYGTGADSWEWGDPSQGPYPDPGFDTAHSGSNIWATNLDGNYNDNEDSYLESPDIDLSVTEGEAPRLSWWQALWTSWPDSADVQVSNDGGQTWNTIYGPVSGEVDRNWAQQNVLLDTSFAVFNFRVRFHLYSDYYDTHPGWHLDDLAAGVCQPQEGGLVVGNVYDANLGTPLAGAQVTNDVGMSTLTAPTDDPAVGDAFYTLFSPAGLHELTASYPDYAPVTDTVDIQADGTVLYDFFLPAGLLMADPGSLQTDMLLGDVQEGPLELNNNGSGPAEFDIHEISKGFIPTSAGELNLPHRKSPANSDEQAAITATPVFPKLMEGAEVLLVIDNDSWGPAIETILANNDIAFDMINAWQISGWDFSPYRMIIIPGVQGSNYYEFFNDNLAKFEQFIDEGGLMWMSYATYGEIINIPFGGYNIYDPQYYDYIVEPDYPIFSGVPNPIYGTYASHNSLSTTLPDDRILMTSGEYPGGNPLLVERQHGVGLLVAGGLMFEYGWVYGEDAGQILENMLPYYYNTWPSTQTVPWLDEQPTSDVIPAGGSQPIQITFDASRLGHPGDYLANLLVLNDTPYGMLTIPVTMTVTPPDDWGQLLGTVASLGYCDEGWDALRDAQVLIESSSGVTFTFQTEADGSYYWWLDEAGNPYTVSVTYPDHKDTVISGVYVTHLDDTLLDIPLRWLRPCVKAAPAELETTLEVGTSEVLPMTLTNSGASPTSFELEEADQGWIPWSNQAEPNSEAVEQAGPALEDIRVLLVASSGVSQLQSLLLTFPDLAAVDYYNAASSTPTLSDLVDYDTVIVVSDYYYYFADSVALGDVLADYLDAGGTVIQSVPTFYGGGWALHGRFETDGYSPFYSTADWFYWAELGDYDPSHPIMAGVSQATDYFRQQVTMVMGAEWVASWTDDEFIATKGRVVGLNTGLFDGYVWTGDIPIIVHNCITWLVGEKDIPWLSEEPISGTLHADTGEQVIDVTFDASAVSQPGTYNGTLTVKTDDPVSPRLSVDVLLNALPTADMGQVAGTVTDAWTGNPMTATVELVGVYSTLAAPDYSLWAVQGDYSLKAYASGYYTLTLPVEITAGEVTVQDIALEPAMPRLGELPGQIEMTLVAGSSGSQSLAIANTGPMPLDFAFHEINPHKSLGRHNYLAGMMILYDQAHCQGDLYSYTTLTSDLAGMGATIDTNYDPFDESTLPGYDILWLNSGGCTWEYDELEILQGWLEDGGAVLIQGENSLASTPPASIFSISYADGYCNSGTTTNILPHPITEGVDEFYIDWTCGYITGSPETIVLDQSMQGHIIAAEQAQGKMVVVADDDFIDWVINNNDNRLLAMNAFQWLATPVYSDIPWLSEDPVQGSLDGHTSLEATLTFDASDLPVGVYDGLLAIEHNDPNQVSPVVIPVQLNVIIPVSPTGVTISGPEAGAVGQPQVFIAAVEPISATLPLTYVWEADGQALITHTAGISDMVSFTWGSPGVQHITVTATNLSGSVVANYQITISAAFYLPLAQKAPPGGKVDEVWQTEEGITEPDSLHYDRKR